MMMQKRGGKPCRYRVLGGVLAAVCALVVGLIATSQPLAAKESLAEKDVRWGVKMARRGLWSEAMFRFQEASELDPNNPRILNNLAVSLEAVGRFEEALEAYQRALKLDSTSRDLRQNYARFVEFYQAFKGTEEAQTPVPERDPNADPPAEEFAPEPVSDDPGSGG